MVDSGPSPWAILTAAGEGSRLGSTLPKALVEVGEQSLLQLSLNRLAGVRGLAGVVVTAPVSHLDAFTRAVERAQLTQSVNVFVVAGAHTRQASVCKGLDQIAEFSARNRGAVKVHTPILVHDAARCLTPTGLMDTLVDKIRDGASAVIPTLPVVDTIKIVDLDSGLVLSTPRRDSLRIVQTPQAFTWEVLRRVHLVARARGDNESTAATDDAALAEEAGIPVVAVQGSPLAFKITVQEDLEKARQIVLN